MKNIIAYGLLCVFSFFLHFIWELLHQPLYAAHDALGHGVPLALWAAGGDVMYTLFIVCTLAIFEKGISWMLYASLMDYASCSGLGFFVALFVEYKAFWFHLWSYAPAMPIIPIFAVGLSPVLQMMMLTPLCIYLTKKTGEFIF